MIELFFAFLIGVVLGAVLKKEKQKEPPAVEILQNQIDYYQEQIDYYKKLTKGVVNENMEMRRKLGGWNNPDLRTYDGKLK